MFEPASDSKIVSWKLRFISAVFAVLLVAGAAWIWRMTQMPLQSYRGQLPLLSAEEAQTATRLSAHIKYLSETVGKRNLSQPGSLQVTADYLRRNLQQAGYVVNENVFTASGQKVTNIEAKLQAAAPTSGDIILGAHYDTAGPSPGANDNASGVAGLLELARLLHESKFRRNVRFVFFANEEPPYFQTDEMGSLVYARQLRRDHVQVVAMLSLETIGYYSDSGGSQKYPPGLSLFYGRRGNFVGFVANPESRDLLHLVIREFRESTNFPSEGIAAPADWPGIGWSDHWSFWQQGYPAIMVTDTAPFRYPYYHKASDTLEHVDCERMAKVVEGIRRVVESLATQD